MYGGRKAAHSPVIRSQIFSESMPLGCEPHTSFSVSFFPRRWDKLAGVAWTWVLPSSHRKGWSQLELGISLPPGQLGLVN